MGDEWRQGVLGDLIELKRGFDLPRQDRHPGAIPIVSSSGITDVHSVAMVAGPGVVTGRYGTLGEVFYVEEDFWPLNTTLYVRDFKGNDPRFISYFLRGIDFLAYSDKAAVPGLNRNHLHQAIVRFPSDVAEQRTIADILGALDDKIELNRRMSETLEAIARALFKSWFVDFDPVRAKAEGRDPGLAKPIADLFPDRFETSEIGLIPAGWMSASIRDVAQCVKGRSYASEDLQAGDTALVTLKSFARGGGYREDGLKPYIGDYRTDQVLSPGELIVACTDVTQAAEVIGKPALVGSSGEFATLVASLDVLVVRPIDQGMSLPFLYCLFRADQFSEHTYALSSGTTVLHLSADAVPSYPFALPPAEVAQAFASLAEPTFKRIDQNRLQSHTLAAIRDGLLPKLTSGELRVPRAESLLQASPA